MASIKYWNHKYSSSEAKWAFDWRIIHICLYICLTIYLFTLFCFLWAESSQYVHTWYEAPSGRHSQTAAASESPDCPLRGHCHWAWEETLHVNSLSCNTCYKLARKRNKTSNYTIFSVTLNLGTDCASILRVSASHLYPDKLGSTDSHAWVHITNITSVTARCKIRIWVTV